jgi:RNA polymerase sigma factor (sigma-70 family)
MKKESKSDLELHLVQGLGRGDQAVLDRVYRQYYPVVESLVLRNNGTEMEARDVFQDAVILLYQKLQTRDFRLTCSIKTFLYAISKRLWLKRWHEHKSRVYDTEVAADADQLYDIVQGLNEEEENFEKMEKALEKLGEPCASILKDFYLQGMSMIEITQKYGYTNPDNAKNQKYKCLQRLKKLFFHTSTASV